MFLAQNEFLNADEIAREISPHDADNSDKNGILVAEKRNGEKLIVHDLQISARIEEAIQ